MLPVKTRTDRLARLGDPFWRLEDEFGRMFRRFLGDGGKMLTEMTGMDVDMWEDDEHVYIEAEMPGIKKEDLDVTLEGGVLTIRGRKQERKRQGASYLSELTYGEFARSFQLPVGVDPDKIHAQLKDGILCVTLDKSPSAKPQKINVE